MKKILMLAACTAAMTAITSCSSNDDDVLSQAPVAPVTGGVVSSDSDAVAAKGTPFSVVVTDDSGNTRATLLNGTTLANFKLYGKNTDLETPMWINGNVFKFGTDWAAYNAAGTATAELTWPVDGQNKSLTTASQFWAVSDNSDAGVTIGTTTGTSSITENNIATDNPNFVYGFNTGNSTSGLRVSLQIAAEELTNVVKLNEQKDLLVASGSQTEGSDGQLTLAFHHALSSLAFKAKFAAAGQSVEEDFNIYVYWIRIHGLKGSATFTYNDSYGTDANHPKRWATSPWSNPTSDVVYEYVFSTDCSGANSNADQPNAYHLVAGEEGDNTKYEMINHTDIMIIPQAFTPWAGHDSGALSNAYVEVCFKTTNTSDSRKISRTVGYLPLKITSSNNNFLAGVKHTVTLDFNYLMKANGDYLQDPGASSGNE